VLNTKIKGITKIWLVNDFDQVTSKFFVFLQKNLKIMASMSRNIQQCSE
jgi:hypothetical protein